MVVTDHATESTLLIGWTVDLGDDLMKVWLACFLLLFALAQFFDWIQELALPLPVYILGGAFLAIASNYDKLIGVNTTQGTINSPSAEPQLAATMDKPISFTISRQVEESETEL